MSILHHACFISFPGGRGKDNQFAKHFYEEFSEQLAAIDKRLSIFKYDCCNDRRRGDDWRLWIQKELCHSAMMIAVCAPNYFTGSPACVSEFRGMELLIKHRNRVLGNSSCRDWLVALRLKNTLPMPALNPYVVKDFLDCCASPEKVRRTHRYRKVVEDLAERVYGHWLWINTRDHLEKLGRADICASFELPLQADSIPDEFPRAGGIL